MKTQAQEIWDMYPYERQKAVLETAAFQFFVEHQKKILESDLMRVRENKNLMMTTPDLDLTVKPEPQPPQEPQD